MSAVRAKGPEQPRERKTMVRSTRANQEVGNKPQGFVNSLCELCVRVAGTWGQGSHPKRPKSRKTSHCWESKGSVGAEARSQGLGDRLKGHMDFRMVVLDLPEINYPKGELFRQNNNFCHFLHLYHRDTKKLKTHLSFFFSPSLCFSIPEWHKFQ